MINPEISLRWLERTGAATLIYVAFFLAFGRARERRYREA